LQSISSGDATGALFKYNIQTKQVTVLLSGLSGAAGTAVSSDGSFALVTEFTGKRIRRFWLKGARSNTSETFITLQGMPDNIRRAANGDFWVAVNVLKPGTLGTVPTRIRINPLGKVVASVALDKEYNTTLISEVQEFHGTIYVGSLLTNFVGLYRII
jgi:strictosidine synthase